MYNCVFLKEYHGQVDGETRKVPLTKRDGVCQLKVFSYYFELQTEVTQTRNNWNLSLISASVEEPTARN